MTNSRGSHRRTRIASAVAVAVAAITAFASLGGAGLAQSAIGLAQYQYGKKVTICHKGKKTIRVSVRALPAHKRHGDTEGPCVGTAGKKHEKQGEHHGAGKHEQARGDSQGAAVGGRSDDHPGNGKGRGKGNGTS